MGSHMKLQDDLLKTLGLKRGETEQSSYFKRRVVDWKNVRLVTSGEGKKSGTEYYSSTSTDEMHVWQMYECLQ